MIKVTFVEGDGNARIFEVRGGMTLMEAAVREGVAGIEAICGGSCACATCHVYVNETWLQSIGRAHERESEMLDAVPNRQANSRLSCQIKLAEHMNGLEVRVPSSQPL